MLVLMIYQGEELPESDPRDIEGYGLPIHMSSEEKEGWMKKQKETKWDSFCGGNLILKSGKTTLSSQNT